MKNDETKEQPATAVQVAKRALVLAVVTCRGTLERDAANSAATRVWRDAKRWWTALHLSAELESNEKLLLKAPLGCCPENASLDAGWRAEALAVLAWALNRDEMPAHDRQVNPGAVARSVGFLSEPLDVSGARLRSATELKAYREVAFSVHWRLREFFLTAKRLDFVKVAKKHPWFDSRSLKRIPLVSGDLRIGNRAIASADPAEVRVVMSIAQERHQAINWVLNASSPLSAVDTST
jgi:hypothetical protein